MEAQLAKAAAEMLAMLVQHGLSNPALDYVCNILDEYNEVVARGETPSTTTEEVVRMLDGLLQQDLAGPARDRVAGLATLIEGLAVQEEGPRATIEEVAGPSEAEPPQRTPAHTIPLRRPRPRMGKESRQETASDRPREEGRQEAAPQKSEEVGRQETVHGKREEESRQEAASEKTKEAADSAASLSTEGRWRVLESELDAVSAEFAAVRARLEAAHAKIREFAAEDDATKSIVHSSATWARVEYQAAGLRGLKEGTRQARDEQARRRQAEEERQRLLEETTRQKEAAQRKLHAMEEAARRRRVEREERARREEERVARELERARRDATFAELKEEKIRRKMEHRAENPVTRRCFICGMEGVRRSYQCPRAREHHLFK